MEQLVDEAREPMQSQELRLRLKVSGVDIWPH